MEAIQNFHTYIFEWVHGLLSGNPLIATVWIFVAQYAPYAMALLFILILINEKSSRRRFVIFSAAAISVIVSRGIITEWMHFFISSPRPFLVYNFTPLINEASNSFPSGHAAFFFALAGIMLFVWRGWGIAFLIFAVINGFSRIVLGVHWPFDVLIGALIGLGVAGCVGWAMRLKQSLVVSHQ